MSEVNLNEDLPEDENSLDNFFKKKDKKGKKKKSKKTEASEEVIEVAKTKKPETETKKESAQDEEPKETDQEWIDFEDESQRDYSDLKIQNLQVNENEGPPPPVDVPEYNDAGELLPPKQDEGPWKNVKSETNAPSQVVEEPKPATPPPEPKKTGAYRPPQARSSQAFGSSLAPVSLRRTRRQQQAPEINNELDFPSLEAAAKDTVEHKGFEMVKTGVKSSASWRSNQQQNQTTNISLGNQFSALNTQ